MNKPSKNLAKKRAWKAFSLFIRRFNANKHGMANCYTCGKSDHWKKLQAGHGIGGRNNAVLFEESIVRTQCVGCNLYGRGKYAIFTRKLIDELGIKEYDRLVSASQDIIQYKTDDFLEIERYYKCQFQELEKGECEHGVRPLTKEARRTKKI